MPQCEKLRDDIIAERYGKPMRAALHLCDELERDRQALLECLRRASDCISAMTDGPRRANWGDMLDEIDALLERMT